ncbi:MAG: hypothetical protein LC130_23345 [Bryobacterales bacterium]|nr:hypothetical protein [Bryobacterales bacterium]
MHTKQQSTANQLTPAQIHLAQAQDELNHQLTLIRFAMGRGDLGAAFRAINAATKQAQVLVSVNKQLSAALESALITMQQEKEWTDELLRRMEILDPVFLEIVMTADEVTEEPND